jgi:ribosome-binding factor A
MAEQRRVAKIEKAIAKEIAEALVSQSRDPRAPAIVSITRVEVTPDLSHARVYWSILGGAGQKRTVTRMFEDSKGFFQSLVAKRLAIRLAPVLSFHFDDLLEKRTRIESLIDSAIAEDRGEAQPPGTDVDGQPDGK